MSLGTRKITGGRRQGILETAVALLDPSNPKSLRQSGWSILSALKHKVIVKSC